MKKIITVFMLVIVAMMTVACATDSSKIVGNWSTQEKVLGTINTETRYTFNEDGTGKVRTVLGIEFNMTYGIDNENKSLTIKTSTLGIENTDVYTYRFENKNLILEKEGEEIVCTRYVEEENTENSEFQAA